MLDLIVSLLAFLLAFGVLVIVHEFGHFWVARRFGIQVERFSLGFGRPIWRYRDKLGTEYVLGIFPLGGYVKLLEENNASESSSPTPIPFSQQPIPVRFAVAAAGPLFNILFAIFAYGCVFMLGTTEITPVVGKIIPGSIAEQAKMHSGVEITAMDGQQTNSWQAVGFAIMGRVGDVDQMLIDARDIHTGQVSHYRLDLKSWSIDMKDPKPLDSLGITPYYPAIPPVIGAVIAGGPADKAGFFAGDRVVSVNGHSIHEWNDMVDLVESQPKKVVAVDVLRDGNTLHLDVVPQEQKTELGKTIGLIGVQSKQVNWPPRFMHEERYSPLTAWGPALHKTWSTIVLTVLMLIKLVTGKLSLGSLSGPIGIASGAGASASLGLSAYLSFLALISVSLAILNILPIPALDGGFLLYCVIELVRRKPLSERAQEIGTKIGILFLLGLMMVSFYNDLLRIFG